MYLCFVGLVFPTRKHKVKVGCYNVTVGAGSTTPGPKAGLARVPTLKTDAALSRL